MQGGNNGDDWDAFDWLTWGTEDAHDSHDGHDNQNGTGHGRDERDALRDRYGDDRRTGIEDGSVSSGEGKWVSQGGILRWEGAEDDEEAPATMQDEISSRWAADEVDLPPGAPDTLRIRAAHAWLASQRALESEAIGLLLYERRQLQPAESEAEETRPSRSAPVREDDPIELALTEHQAALEEYEALLAGLDEIVTHSGPGRVLVEFHLWLSERLAELATAPEAPAEFGAQLLLAEVEDEESAGTGRPAPTPHSLAAWQGRAEAVLAARRRVERVSAPEPED